MSSERFPEEFKIEAVKQVTERGHPVSEVASWLRVSQHSLYEWIKRFSRLPAERAEARSQQEEVRRLSELLKQSPFQTASNSSEAMTSIFCGSQSSNW